MSISIGAYKILSQLRHIKRLRLELPSQTSSRDEYLLENNPSYQLQRHRNTRWLFHSALFLSLLKSLWVFWLSFQSVKKHRYGSRSPVGVSLEVEVLMMRVAVHAVVVLATSVYFGNEWMLWRHHGFIIYGPNQRFRLVPVKRAGARNGEKMKENVIRLVAYLFAGFPLLGLGLPFIDHSFEISYPYR